MYALELNKIADVGKDVKACNYDIKFKKYCAEVTQDVKKLIIIEM